MARQRRRGKKVPGLPKGFFLSREPVRNGYVLKSLTVPFKGAIRRLWLRGDYRTIWEELRERVPTGGRVQSVRLVINGWLQKRALRPDVADFEQYMLQLVRISPGVTDGITGFSLRLVYKQPAKSKHDNVSKLRRKRNPSLGKKRKQSLRALQRKRAGSKLPRRDKRGRFVAASKKTRRKQSR